MVTYLFYMPLKRVAYFINLLKSLTLRLNELEMFLDGKINIPEKIYEIFLRRVNELKETYNNQASIVPGKTLNDLSKIIAGDHDKEMKIYAKIKSDTDNSV